MGKVMFLRVLTAFAFLFASLGSLQAQPAPRSGSCGPWLSGPAFDLAVLDFAVGDFQAVSSKFFDGEWLSAGNATSWEVLGTPPGEEDVFTITRRSLDGAPQFAAYTFQQPIGRAAHVEHRQPGPPRTDEYVAVVPAYSADLALILQQEQTAPYGRCIYILPVDDDHWEWYEYVGDVAIRFQMSRITD